MKKFIIDINKFIKRGIYSIYSSFDPLILWEVGWISFPKDKFNICKF